MITNDIPTVTPNDLEGSVVSVQVRLAETRAELDQLFQLRHRVFCEERGYAPKNRARRLRDRFDAIPGVANFIAITGGQVIGGCRIVTEYGGRLPAYDYFDFSPMLPQRADVCAGSIGMLVVDPAHRRARVFSLLINAAHVWSVQHGLTHLLAPVAPEVEPRALRLGYVALAPQFFHERLRVLVTPMLFDLKKAGACAASHDMHHVVKNAA